MNWSSIRGHSEQVQMLRRSLSRGRLAHAYLFAGPPGIGKSRFARVFAQALFCERHEESELEPCNDCHSCREMNAESHPDFFYISKPEDKAEISVNRFIGEPEKRPRDGLIYDLSLKPMEATRRIALIDDANFMNDEGANAMLKTLEEPPPHSVLILIAENLDAVLPTIRSRCQLLRFSALSQQDVAELLIENEMASSPEDAAAVAAMSEGSLQVAAQLLKPELRQLRDQLSKYLSSADMNPIAAAKTMLEGIDASGHEASENRRNVGWLIRFAQEFYRQATLLITNPNGLNSPSLEVRSFAERQRKLGTVGLERTLELFDRVLEAEKHISMNIAPARTIDSLFDDLAQLGRRKVATP